MESGREFSVMALGVLWYFMPHNSVILYPFAKERIIGQDISLQCNFELTIETNESQEVINHPLFRITVTDNVTTVPGTGSPE